MTQVHCDRKHCLNNNKYGICTADTIEYEGICQSYITQNDARKTNCGLCRRIHGKLKRNSNTVLR